MNTDLQNTYMNNKNKYNNLTQIGGDIFENGMEVPDIYKHIMSNDINLILNDEKFYDEKKPIKTIFVPITRLEDNNITTQNLTILINIINTYEFGNDLYVTKINESFPTCSKVMYFLSAFLFFADQFVKYKKILGDDNFINDISEINKKAIDTWYTGVAPSDERIEFIRNIKSDLYNLLEIVDEIFLSSSEMRYDSNIIMLFNKGMYIGSVYTGICTSGDVIKLTYSMIGIRSNIMRLINCHKNSRSLIFTKDTCLSENAAYCIYISQLLFVFLKGRCVAGIRTPIGRVAGMLGALYKDKNTIPIYDVMKGREMFLDNSVLDWFGVKLRDQIGNWIFMIPDEKSDSLSISSINMDVIFENVRETARKLIIDFCKNQFSDEQIFDNDTLKLNNMGINWDIINDINFEEKVSLLDDEIKKKLNDMNTAYKLYKKQLILEEQETNHALIQKLRKSLT